jgi:hypothetical protein
MDEKGEKKFGGRTTDNSTREREKVKGVRIEIRK